MKVVLGIRLTPLDWSHQPYRQHSQGPFDDDDDVDGDLDDDGQPRRQHSQGLFDDDDLASVSLDQR